jgi:hypothetical protein
VVGQSDGPWHGLTGQQPLVTHVRLTLIDGGNGRRKATSPKLQVRALLNQFCGCLNSIVEAVMRLEAGKKYTDRRGRVYGPLIEDSNTFYEDECGTNWWSDGRVSTKKESLADLVAEYVEPEPVVPEKSFLQKAYEAAAKCMDCTTCGDFCEKTSNPTEVWPKWFQIAEGHIAEFPETGGSTNYRRGEKDTEGYPASHYHGQFPEFWKQITSFDAMSLMSKWGHIENATPKTRTVTLREWACWEDERESDVTLVWSSRDPTIDDDGFIGWDNAVLTGDVRSIELPVSQ